MSWFKKFFWKEKKSVHQEFLEKLSVHVIKDGRFDERVDLYKIFCDFIANCGKANYMAEPEKIVQTTAEQVHDINNRLHQAATPFGRSGDRDKNWYSEMISCWNTLYSRTLTYTSVIESTLKRLTERGGYKPETQKRQAVQKIRFFFEAIFLDCALTVGDLSWFGEDVTGAWLGAIQTVPGPQGYPPTTMQQPRDFEEAAAKSTQNWGSPKHLKTPYTEDIPEEGPPQPPKDEEE